MENVGQVVRMENMREGYVAVAQFVAERGEKICPRGQCTREIRYATLIVENPLDTLPTGVGRGIVPGIAAVESAQLLAGESRPKLTMAVGPMFANFTENNGEFHGAYGVRTRGQFDTVVRRLTDDPASRQGQVTLWRPDLDGQDRKRDYPCTVAYGFLLRDGLLHMRVLMRSNDVYLGLAYDAFQHSRVQVAIASVLGAGLGEYVHQVDSLHVYERDLEKVKQLTMPQKAPSSFPAITGSTWDDVRTKAQNSLNMAEADEVDLDNLEDGQRWYVESMRKAIEKNHG